MTLKDSLLGIFGNVNFSDSDTDKVVYSQDASEASGNPSYIVWPTGIDQVHKLVLLCKRSNSTIVTRGAGTGLAGSCVPSKTSVDHAIVVDMSKMRNILELGEDYAVVEAGATLKDLNHELRYRLFPVQPESRHSCTIGGMIATNALGLKAMEYRRMIDWIQDITVIDGNGMCLTLKGDALQHFCGTEGTMGIIVRARLKITRKDENRSTSIIQFNTLTAMYDKVKMLRQDPDVRNIEFVDELCSGLLELEDKHHLFVEYCGDKGQLKGKDSEEAWKTREKLPKLLRKEKYCIMESAEVPETAKFLHWMQKNNIPCYGPIGLNFVTIQLKDTRPVPEMKRVLKMLDGKLGTRYGYGTTKKEYVGREWANKLQALKHYYDPKNIMNRGKLI